MSKVKRVKLRGNKPKPGLMFVFAVMFAAIGTVLLWNTYAAPGACSTSGTVGSATYSVTAPETAQYRLWVRMQVPETTNTGNNNGVRVEIDSNQCFQVTTTNASAVNQWMWINSDAQAVSTPHITSQISAGTRTVKMFGLKAGVKVDKVLLLKSDNTCTPSNDFSSGDPGDNCTVSAPTVNLTANPTTVTSGSASTLTWTTTDADSCTASGDWTGSRTASGTQSTGNLTSNKTYTLTCTGPGGSGSDSVSVTVNAPPAPTVDINASPTSVVSGNPSTLSWTSTNASSCTASGSWTGAKSTSGSESTGNLTANSTFTITCTGTGGSANDSVAVTVTSTPPPNDTTPPSVTFNIPNVTLSGSETKVVIRTLKSVTWQPLASDASGIKSLTLTINDSPVNLTGGQVTIGSANGDYNVRAVVTDNADNVTTKTLAVKIRHPDVNRSGRVDLLDLSLLMRNWGTVSSVYDLDDSGTVNLFDLSYLMRQWNSTQ